MEQYLDVIVSALVALAIAAIGYAKTYIDNKRLRERMDSIVDVLHNEESRYYVNCPTCDRKILLAEVEIKSDKKEG